MYGIYKHDNSTPSPILVGVCHTKIGAKRACRHFFGAYTATNGHTFCRVEFKEVDSYIAIRAGYALLQVVRKMEERKLVKLRQKRNYQEKLYDAQARRVASLY